MCLTSATCCLSDLRKPPSAAEPPPWSRQWSSSCDLTNVTKRKLWTFGRPLGLPGHRRQDFNVGDVSYHRKIMVRVRDNCHCSWSMSPPSPFHIEPILFPENKIIRSVVGEKVDGQIYWMLGVRNQKFYLVPGVRNGQIYLVRNDSYEKFYLAVKGLIPIHHLSLDKSAEQNIYFD